MAVNQNHTASRHGAVIPYGESVLQQCQDVELSFPQQPERSTFFSGTKRGTLFLTSYRVIFVTSHTVNDPMLSFMMPFDLMKDCTVEQPVFAPNFIKGTIMAAPEGGWEGQAMFKLSFRKGGAIQFSQLMMKAASAAARGAPLRSINYWYGPPGTYVVVSGQGNMLCTPQMPCAAQPRPLEMQEGITPGKVVGTQRPGEKASGDRLYLPISPSCCLWSPTSKIWSLASRI
ncbi:postacrosomal sheath WW domain-binding protein [Tamandua tetradactyla]|uniref:postacrosomal sheath WW domain-binding protein n=1 Tax=Tamandua tetradactyla TaxID=48850 RepID=UPI00405472E9